MKYTEEKKCYRCDNIATTYDHIPPKCFFPKKKHLPSDSPNYRSNLITVPACAEHNNERSQDDQYTATVISMNSKSDLALRLFESKWLPTLLRRRGSLGTRIFANAREVTAIHKTNNSILIPKKTLAIRYEIDRIKAVIESIACAIYYIESERKNKLRNGCIIKSNNFINNDLSEPNEHEKIKEIDKNLRYGEKYPELNLERKGVHPDIFYYQFFQYGDEKFIIKMVFYSDFVFFALPM
jgi:hypothetical protein